MLHRILDIATKTFLVIIVIPVAFMVVASLGAASSGVGALFIGELVLGGIVFILNYVPRAFRKRD